MSCKGCGGYSASKKPGITATSSIGKNATVKEEPKKEEKK